MGFRASNYRDILRGIKQREEYNKNELIWLLLDCMKHVDEDIQNRIKQQIIKLK